MSGRRSAASARGLSVAQLRLRVADNLRLNPATIMPSYYKVDGLEPRRLGVRGQADPDAHAKSRTSSRTSRRCDDRQTRIAHARARGGGCCKRARALRARRRGCPRARPPTSCRKFRRSPPSSPAASRALQRVRLDAAAARRQRPDRADEGHRRRPFRAGSARDARSASFPKRIRCRRWRCSSSRAASSGSKSNRAFASPATQRIVAVATMSDGALLRRGGRGHRDARRLHGRDLTHARRTHQRSAVGPARQAVRGADHRSATRWRPAIGPTRSGKSIPRNVIRTFTCRYNGDVVFSARLSSGIAANPYLRFFVTAQGVGRSSRSNGSTTTACAAATARRSPSSDAARCGSSRSRSARSRSSPSAQPLRAGARAAAVGAALRHHVRGRRRARDAGGRRRESRLPVGRKRREAVERAGRRGRQELRVVPWRRARVDARRRGALSALRRRRRRRCWTSRRASTIAACAGSRRAALARESEELLSLTAYVAFQSRGIPLAVTIDGPARAAFERGRAFYEARHGQMNLACAQCHDQNWGKRLLERNA